MRAFMIIICSYHVMKNVTDLENGSKSHMKSSVFQHVFNYNSTYVYVFPKNLLHNFDNLRMQCYEIMSKI